MQISQQTELTNSQIPLNFPLDYKIVSIIEEKPYIPISSCVLDYIIVTKELKGKEKLYHLLANSLALISSNYKGKRTATLPGETWAERLSCSERTIYRLQQSIEKKDHFDIVRSRNKFNKNNRNCITPTLPSKTFEYLNTKKNITNKYVPFDSSKDTVMTYLDKTKHFFKFNYDLLKIITNTKKLTTTQKIIWIDLYTRASNKYKFNNQDNNNLIFNNQLQLVSSHSELIKRHSYTKGYISKILTALEEAGFIITNDFNTSNNNSDEQDEQVEGYRQDISLLEINITLPREYIIELTNLKNRAAPSSDSNKAEKISCSYSYPSNFGVSYLSPQVSYLSPLLNISSIKQDKYYCNIDYIDANNQNYTKFSSFYLSNSSIFFKNSFSFNFDYPEPKKTNSKTENQKSLITTNNQLIKNDQPDKKQNKLNNENQDNKNLTPIQVKEKTLKEYHEILTNTQCSLLRSKSGRDFNNNFIKQLILHLGNKYPNLSFMYANQFIKYMTEALINEKRQPADVNHDTYRLVPNAQERETFEQEKIINQFLTKLENNKNTDKLTQLQKKFGNIFEPHTAYKLLTETDFISGFNDEFITLKIPRNINITEKQHEIIQNQIEAVYGYINSKIEYVEQSHSQLAQKNTDKTLTKEEQQQEEESYIANIDTSTLWGNFRRNLITCLDSYRQSGIGLDKFWFSKLDAEIDVNTGNLIIKAPTNFYKDWITQKYISYLEQTCQSLNLKLNRYNPIIVYNGMAIQTEKSYL